MQLLKLIGITLCAMFLVACKIKIIVPADGGRVTTLSGNYSCEAGQECLIDVIDATFNETFIAESAEGYQFDQWKDETGWFCGGDTGNCPLTTVFFSGNDFFLNFLATNPAEYFVEPVFSEAGVGGAAWAWRQDFCDSWTGSVIDLVNQAPSDEEFGVKADMFELPGLDENCTTDEFTYEDSPFSGQRRLVSQSPIFFTSKQGEEQYRESDVYSYSTPTDASQTGDYLSQVVTYPVTSGVANPSDDATEIERWRYENLPDGTRRAISYEVLEPAGEEDNLTLVYELNWEYEDDGSVPSAAFRQYEEDFGYIEGTVSYVPAGSSIIATTRADIGGQTYTLEERTYLDRGPGELGVPLPPPTGQILTENAWVLPESIVVNVLDLETGLLIGDQKEEVVRRSAQGYPLESHWSLWDSETDEWVVETRNYYGYKTDAEGTIYLWIDLEENRDLQGRWQPSVATQYRFRSDPLILSP